jgi:hypothetical protein
VVVQVFAEAFLAEHHTLGPSFLGLLKSFQEEEEPLEEQELAGWLLALLLEQQDLLGLWDLLQRDLRDLLPGEASEALEVMEVMLQVREPRLHPVIILRRGLLLS